MQLCIKYLMPNLKLWLLVFFFQLSSAHRFIHYWSHLFTSLTAFLLLAIGIVPKLLFFVQKNSAIVTEAKLKDSCHEQGQTEGGKRPNKKREICYFSFPRGLIKMYKIFKKNRSSPFPWCTRTWKSLQHSLQITSQKSLCKNCRVSCMTNIKTLVMSLPPLWITSVPQIIISYWQPRSTGKNSVQGLTGKNVGDTSNGIFVISSEKTSRDVDHLPFHPPSGGWEGRFVWHPYKKLLSLGTFIS